MGHLIIWLFSQIHDILSFIFQELENRQKVRNDLSQFVDDIVVPQTMIK